jgi:CheY-like chemotaxis protein/signal transduction histidine kinase
MKSQDQLINSFESILSSLKKMENAAGVLSDLSKISAELETLDHYVRESLKNVNYQFDTFTQNTNLLSEVIDFQKKLIQSKNIDRSVETIFNFLEEKTAFDLGFIIYKLKEEDETYEIITQQREQAGLYRKLVDNSQWEGLKQFFIENESAQLVTDLAAFGHPEVQWALLHAKSLILFPLKARGHLFGIGFLVRQKKLFELKDLSSINLLNTLISLVIYQNFYFAWLKSKFIQQSRLSKVLDEVKYPDFFENGPLFLFTLDSRFVVLHANAAALKNIEINGEAIIGENFFEIIPSSQRAAFQKFVSENKDRPFQVFRCPLQVSAGHLSVMEFIVSPLNNNMNSAVYLVLAGEVTGNYFREVIDHRNEILDEIDQFSRILVNQFNNLLMVLFPNINMLKRIIPANHPQYVHLESMQRAAQRSANLVQKFLNYDVEDLENFEIGNLNKFINSYATAVKKELPDYIQVQIELDPVIKNSRIYPLRLRRLLDILMSNSIIALQGRKNALIKFSSRIREQKKDGLVDGKPFFLKKGKYLEICVWDNGIGIPEKSLTQVLKPFYSTRIKNEGVGLELFIAYNLIKDMKGFIFFDSKVDQYTAVYLYWPFREEKEMGTRVVELPKEEKKVQAKQATVLVVDDEYNIRTMMKEIMEMAGMKVYTAGDGRAGVDIYQRHKKDIDLIVMDMVMPIMDGRAAFNEIRKINPKQKIFIISGYSQREDLQDILDNGAVGFLRKPFQVKEIVEKIQEILHIKS